MIWPFVATVRLRLSVAVKVKTYTPAAARPVTFVVKLVGEAMTGVVGPLTKVQLWVVIVPRLSVADPVRVAEEIGREMVCGAPTVTTGGLFALVDNLVNCNIH